MKIVRAGAARFDERPRYRASMESRAELGALERKAEMIKGVCVEPTLVSSDVKWPTQFVAVPRYLEIVESVDGQYTGQVREVIHCVGVDGSPYIKVVLA